MSSCFLCDTSYLMNVGDSYRVVYEEGKQRNMFMKYMPIMIGSTGMQKDDQQHTNDKTQNYVSYKVNKIEFRCSINAFWDNSYKFPSYIIIFKVPFREPIFDYYFTLMKEFILYSEPESVLDYCVCQPVYIGTQSIQRHKNDFNITITKPFIVGPNDYVGVLYFFQTQTYIYSSAKVWFDVV